MGRNLRCYYVSLRRMTIDAPVDANRHPIDRSIRRVKIKVFVEWRLLFRPKLFEGDFAMISDRLEPARRLWVALLKFVGEVVKLQSKPVLDVEKYEPFVLWFAEVPDQDGCFSCVRQAPQDEVESDASLAEHPASDEDVAETEPEECEPSVAHHAKPATGNRDQDVWLRVTSRPEPTRPPVPTICAPWVDERSVNSTSDIPQLKRERTVNVANLHGQPGSEEAEQLEVERLEKHPEVEAAWDRYVENEWLPWAEKHRQWEQVNKAYSCLFHIYQEQKRRGEEYELVVGLGLLTWAPEGCQAAQRPTSARAGETTGDYRPRQPVRRHVLVVRVELEFIANQRRFTVRTHADHPRPEMETNMFDGPPPPAFAEAAIGELLDAVADDPRDKQKTERLLHEIRGHLDAQATYDPGLQPPTSPTGQARITYAPALILRKRANRAIEEMIEKILNGIIKGADVRPLFDDGPGPDGPPPDAPPSRESCKLYFPKPANNEQRKIVEYLERAAALLVQGPPGTGKSHTIANLICHLLATGKRVLVTAKTPRALKVLQGMLPEPVRPLCVSLLGAGVDERRELEKSIAGIQQRWHNWQEERAKREIDRLERELEKLRGKLAAAEKRLIEIREAETHRHSVGNGAYSGTGRQIAERVARERETFGWFAEDVPTDLACPISRDELAFAIRTLRRLHQDRGNEPALLLPDPLPHGVEGFFKDEKEALHRIDALKHEADCEICCALSQLERHEVERLADALKKIVPVARHLAQRSSDYPFLRQAVADLVAGQGEAWEKRLNETCQLVNYCKPRAQRADAAKLDLPAGVDLKSLYDASANLKKYLEAGGKVRQWWILRPRKFKNLYRPLRAVRVNGRKCNTQDTICSLPDILGVHLCCQRARNEWLSLCPPQPPSTFVQEVVELGKRCDALAPFVQAKDAFGVYHEVASAHNLIIAPPWDDEDRIRRWVTCCEYICACKERDEACRALERLEQQLAACAADRNAHPISKRLIECIAKRDTVHYAQLDAELDKLRDDHAQLQRAEELLARLGNNAPRLAEEIRQTFAEPHWDERIGQFEDAWRWAQARTWLQHVAQDHYPAPWLEAKRLEEQILDKLAELVAARAWNFCLSRLTEEQRRHMEAWRLAIRRLGKGTGKYAWKHRKSAQEHLAKCRDVIPAWVMPLYRVWDTVPAECRQFDVIIVDEASQCGLDGIPLLLLGKQIVIVGDDQQVSPDAVGIERETVHALVEQYLREFAYKSVLDVETSLFDLGNFFGRTRIRLREHFRCMPEIIAFSNQLCYQDVPLIPLRQFGSDRLEPLQRVFVEEGYRQGNGSSVRNPPEAKRIAEQIGQMCRDPKYEGKTIGVVVLQGEEQGRVLEEQLRALVGEEEFEKRRIVCGNPYAFQGDERDVILLSMVAAAVDENGAKVRVGALTHDGYKRRFNVAASRARDQLWLFHSVRAEDLNAQCMRRRLLDFFLAPHCEPIAGIDIQELERSARQPGRDQTEPPRPFDSWFEIDVALEIGRRGYRVVPQFEVAGYRIDVVVVGGTSRVAVECDGDRFHGPDQYEQDMYRQRMLERCGWTFYRIRASEFYAAEDRARVLSGLWELLNERGIYPLGQAQAGYLEQRPHTPERQAATIPSFGDKQG